MAETAAIKMPRWWGDVPPRYARWMRRGEPAKRRKPEERAEDRRRYARRWCRMMGGWWLTDGKLLVRVPGDPPECFTPEGEELRSHAGVLAMLDEPRVPAEQREVVELYGAPAYVRLTTTPPGELQVCATLGLDYVQLVEQLHGAVEWRIAGGGWSPGVAYLGGTAVALVMPLRP